MSKKIKEIKPNPVLTSAVEIRFSSSLKQEETLGFFYNAFGKEYPKIKERGIPQQLKQQDPNLRFAAEYILSNEKYSFSFANNVVVFENLGGYALWPNYFNIIKNDLNILSDLKIVQSISRVGVRYASIFETNKSISEIINFNLLVGYPGFSQKGEFFRAELRDSNILLNLQIAQNATAQKDTTVRRGLYIDIDASKEENVPASINEELIRVIDDLHSHEKGLFQYLLKQDFLNTLEIIYE